MDKEVSSAERWLSEALTRYPIVAEPMEILAKATPGARLWRNRHFTRVSRQIASYAFRQGSDEMVA